MGLKLNTASGGSVSIEPTNTASNYTLTVPAQTGTVVATDASGNVGIGTSSPDTKLVVAGSNVSGIGLFQIKGTDVAQQTFYINTTQHGQIYADGSQFLLGSVSNTPVVFRTNTTERMRIDSSGNVGIGTSSPSYKLAVNGSVYFTATSGTGYNQSSNTTLGIFGASNEDSVNSGAVYNIEWKMNGNAGGQYWYANYIARNGSRTLGAYCTGTAWTNSSDIANKENITPIKYGLDTVMASKPVDFAWKTQRDADGKGISDIGFIAQEMEQLVPEVVTGQEGSKGIAYGNLVAVAFKAIQEQQAIITELKAELDTVKTELATLKGTA